MIQQGAQDNFYKLYARFSTRELENLANEFPYFQHVHALLAKKYQEEGNPKFDEQLQLAVLYTQDREFLSSLFNEKFTTPLAGDQKVAEQKPESETTEIIEVNPQEEEKFIQEETTGVTEAAEDEIVVVTQQIPEPDEKIQPETLAPATKQPTNEAVNTFALHTFSEWLEVLSKTPITTTKQLISELPEKQEDEPDRQLEQQYIANLPLDELIGEETNYSKGLEHFIEGEKQRHKTQDIKYTDQKETEMPAALITETMARVYEAQKKYSKAISAYEVLSLKYPEKNDFFAARIRELKNLL